jgi:hypothetical protein
MPRDANGVYSLPQPPVATGTVILETWANGTMDDIEDELTDSLDRYGRGGMLVAFENIDGTIDFPGIGFAAEPSVGLRRSAPGVMNASIGGVDVAKWFDDSATPAGSQRPFQVWDGSAWFNPIDPTDPLGDRTFATVSSRGVVTVGNTITAAGGLNVTGGVGVTEDASIDGNLTATGDIIGGIPGYVGCFVQANGFQVGGIGVTSVARTAAGRYTITLDNDWPDPLNPTGYALIAPGVSAFVWPGATNNTVEVRTYPTTGGATADAPFSFFGVQ